MKGFARIFALKQGQKVTQKWPPASWSLVSVVQFFETSAGFLGTLPFTVIKTENSKLTWL